MSAPNRCPNCGRYVDPESDSAWIVPGKLWVMACCTEACADDYMATQSALEELAHRSE